MSDSPSIDLKRLVPSVSASLELADERAAEERLHDALVSEERARERVPSGALDQGGRPAYRTARARPPLSPWLMLLALAAIATPVALALMRFGAGR